MESTGDRSKFGLTARRDRRGGRPAARRGHARLPRAAALPHRLADHRDPRPQGRDARGDAASSSGCTSWARGPRFLDVGGGLGVDYDGSQTNFHSSMNYTVQEYANDVVAAIQEACDEAGVPHPDIVTESGRAMVAHHSVLVFDVLGVNEVRIAASRPSPVDRGRPDASCSDLARDLATRSRARTSRRPTTTRCSSRRRPRTLFTLGYLDLRDARPRRAALLGLLREDPAHRARAAVRARGARGPREGAGRHLLRQLLGVPVGARPLGGQAALPGHADPPARARSRRAAASSPTSPATATARSTSSSTSAT